MYQLHFSFLHFHCKFIQKLIRLSEIIIRKEATSNTIKNYINLAAEPLLLTEDANDSWKNKNIRPEILKYLAARNPLLGTIVEKIHCIESGVETDRTPTKSTPLERLLMSEEINRYEGMNLKRVVDTSAVRFSTSDI